MFGLNFKSRFFETRNCCKR